MPLESACHARSLAYPLSFDDAGLDQHDFPIKPFCLDSFIGIEEARFQTQALMEIIMKINSKEPYFLPTFTMVANSQQFRVRTNHPAKKVNEKSTYNFES